MAVSKKYLTVPTLVFPLFTERFNGCIYVTKTPNLKDKLYFVVEIGLFPMPVQELTEEAIKKKYGVELPEDFVFVS